MYKIIDVNTWKRKDIYSFFKDFDDPFFNICTNIDVGNLYNYCQSKSYSFNLALLFFSLKAVNEIEEFRTRIYNDEVVVYDIINCGSTVLHEDKTFSFCPFEFMNEPLDFIKNGEEIIETIKKQVGLKPRPDLINVVHYSVLPWISFSAIKHPKKINVGDSIPKITFGKYKREGNSLSLPISIEVNHALVDGFHVSEYLALLQNLVNASFSF